MESYSCTNREMVIFGHTWEIKNFDLSKNCDQINGFISKEFAASKESKNKFYIELETLGNEPDKKLGVYLKKSSTNNCCNYTYDFSMSFENKGFCKQSYERTNINFETLTLAYKNMYYEKPNKISADDTLKISYKISIALIDTVYISQNIIPIPKHNILDDFAALLNSEEFADVTIVTEDDKKIRAHKNILSARSKVFAAMFKHPLEESQQNCVKICDLKYEVVLEMLRFIYTESAPKLKDMTEELLSAADKYDLERLKALGLNYLHENLCVETAAMTLKLAYLYQEKELKSIAVQYIKDNSEDVFETPIWKGLDNTDKIQILQSICALKFKDE